MTELSGITANPLVLESPNAEILTFQAR